MLSLLVASGLLAAVKAQQAGTYQTETHPSLTWTLNGQTQQGMVVIDSNWRWTHVVDDYTNCYTGNEWDTSICTDPQTCAQQCALEGADYQATYGISTSGDELSLQFVTQHQYGTNVGSRVYLMANDDAYQMFTLSGNEITFTVDLSDLECGLNGAVYFSQMDENGGLGDGDNEAGAYYGTGYCDSQCARDLKFIGGMGNCEDWTPSTNDANAGVGNMGACCAEMDIWEANAHSAAYTAHPCTNNAYHICEDGGCGGTYSEDRFAGDCDPNGCDYNSYRHGVTDFYGYGRTVDTNQPITVTTQFSQGLISQFFTQGGTVYELPDSTYVDGHELTDEFCSAMFDAFDDRPRFYEVGGWSAMNQALNSPMVLVLSLWDDHYANMLWLDSNYPVDATGPGALRGDCPTSSGVPADVESQYASATVRFSDIRFGPIGSTT